MSSAELNARDQIVMSQPARTCAYYEKALETANAMHGQEYARILKEWKESGTWKDKYETWGAACELAAGLSRSHVNNLIASLSPQTADSPATDKAKTIRRISQLPEPKEDEEEDEKPAVRAATPEQMKRVEPQGPHSEIGPTGKPSENGKPKHSLAIWKELSETHFGRALNRIDELNRQCPNPKYHAALIEAGKKCLAILEQWRQEVG